MSRPAPPTSAGAEVEASPAMSPRSPLAPGNDVIAAQALSAMRCPPATGRSRSTPRDARHGAANRSPDGAAPARRRGLPRPATGAPPTPGSTAVERRQLFAFAAPIFRAWLRARLGQGRSAADPRRPRAGSGSAPAYAAEQRALILLALGRTGRGRRRAPPLLNSDEACVRRRLRVAGAAMLAAQAATATARWPCSRAMPADRWCARGS